MIISSAGEPYACLSKNQEKNQNSNQPLEIQKNINPT